jgi:hypothetical protein
VHVTLHDGSVVSIHERNVNELYDQLWLLAPRPGALAAAAELDRAGSSRLGGAATVGPMNEQQSAALLDALERIQRARRKRAADGDP